MKITPLEIKRQQFKKAMRGYDTDEVDTFLEMMSSEFESAVRRTKELEDKIISLETELKNYKNIEKTLQQTLAQAQEASNKSIDSSRREAELIVKEAQLKASQIIEKARFDFAKMKEEIATLRARKESMLSRLRVLLQSEIDLLRALQVEEEDLTKETPPSDQVDIDGIVKKIQL